MVGDRGESLFILKRKKISLIIVRKSKIRKSCRWFNMFFSGFRRFELCFFLICRFVLKFIILKGSGRRFYGDRV